MKRTLIIVAFAFLITSNVYAKECKILTSQPDYSKMKLITSEMRFSSIPTVKYKPLKHISFTDAYKDFYSNNVEKRIKEACKEYKHVKGVVNLNIQHSLTKGWYHFSASYDYYE